MIERLLWIIAKLLVYQIMTQARPRSADIYLKYVNELDEELQYLKDGVSYDND